jgi:DNA polymerase
MKLFMSPRILMPPTAAPTSITLPESTLAAFRPWLRWLLHAGIEPDAVHWHEPALAQAELFAAGPSPDPPAAPAVHLPARFGTLAETIAWHRGPEKWRLLHRLAHRLHHGDRGLLGRASDVDVVQAEVMTKAVRRDAHKMHAFVRFREVPDAEARDGVRFVAFHRPSHPIVRREAGWFARRFPTMDWAILTPDGSAAWDGKTLSFGPPATSDQAPPPDAAESLWLTYYTHIFNPGRVNPRAMLKEMPRKYWSTMPETRLIPDLLAAANRPGGNEHPARQLDGVSLPQLAEAARSCQQCGLCEAATQVVFGEGPADARLVLVGEQPGDQEDLQGRPFVGPAGQLLDDVLGEVGLDRETIYLTNAVKHFAFEPRGKRRIHRKPKVSEQKACVPWLEAELKRIEPEVIVCLGATAAQNVLGRSFRLTPNLGKVVVSPWADLTLATYHPAAILRASSTAPDRAEDQRRALGEALARARTLLEM